MPVTWAPLHATNDRTSRDHLRDARCALEQAIVALDSAVAGLPDTDPVREIRSKAADALALTVGRIEGGGA